MALSVCGSVHTDLEGRELIEHGTPLFPAACYRDDLREVEIAWHWHDELEAWVVEAGAVRASVNGTDLTVTQGEGFFVNAGALHGIWPEGKGPCFLRSVVFHPRLVGGSVDSILWQKYLEPLLSDPGRPCVHFSQRQDWEKAAAGAILAAWQLCVSEADGFEFAVREQLSRLIFLLAKHCPAAEKKPAEKTLRDGARVKVMLQYIQEHYGGALALADIAASANLSATECLRCFRAMLGTTPIQYVKQVRVQKAAELLLSTRQKISDIGAACGFQEISYFARTFRELKGDTPGAFRKKHAAKAGR